MYDLYNPITTVSSMANYNTRIEAAKALVTMLEDYATYYPGNDDVAAFIIRKI